MDVPITCTLLCSYTIWYSLHVATATKLISMTYSSLVRSSSVSVHQILHDYCYGISVEHRSGSAVPSLAKMEATPTRTTD